jgi:hypothetical protein
MRTPETEMGCIRGALIVAERKRSGHSVARKVIPRLAGLRSLDGASVAVGRSYRMTITDMWCSVSVVLFVLSRLGVMALRKIRHGCIGIGVVGVMWCCD